MADKIDTQVVLELIGNFNRIESQLKDFAGKQDSAFGGLGKRVSESFGEGFLPRLGGIAKGLGLVAAAGLAAKVIIDRVFEGEKLSAFERQFDSLAAQMNISAENLRKGLAAASGGLIDDTDLIKSANKAMIELGQSAVNLPALLDIARRSSAVFGGEVLDNFETINRAIASGQTRSLRNIGIFIDQEKAVREFARSLGVTENALNQAGRSQAILNALMETANKNLQNVNLNATPATNALQRIRVSINDMAEAVTIRLKDIFGPVVAAILEKMASAAEAASNSLKNILGNGVDSLHGKTIRLQRELDLTNQTIEKLTNDSNLSNSSMFQYGEVLKNAKLRAGELKDQIQGLNKSIIDQTLASAKSQAAEKAAQAAGGGSRFVNPEQVEADANRIRESLRRIRDENLTQQLQNAIDEQNFDEQKRLNSERAIVLFEEFQARRNELFRLYAEKHLIDQQQFETALSQLNETEALKREDLDKTMKQRTLQISQAFHGAIVNVASSGFQRLGASLAQGKNAFDGFGKQILGILGDMAIQMGTVILSAGIAMKSLTGPGALTGAPAIIAGAALITVGGLLKAFSSQDAGDGAGGGGVAAGGALGSGVGGGSATAEPVLPEAKPRTEVTITVNGPVDSRSAAIEIANLLREGALLDGIVTTVGV